MSQELIPRNLPDYRDVLAEGRAIADSIEMGESKFKKEHGMNVTRWRNEKAKTGEIVFLPQLGVSTLEQQERAQKEVYERCKRNGVELGVNLITSNWINGVPTELRDKIPKSTSFVMNGAEDFKRLADASPMQPIFADYTCMCPNSVSNVVNAIRAGCAGVGTFSQIAWKYPYCDDDVAQVVAAVTALGILSGKVRESEEVQIQGYQGDGIASAFVDRASELGFTLFEQYIAEQLCGVPYKEGLGGTMSNIPDKLAMWLATYEGLKENARFPNRTIINFYQGNTLEPGNEPMANYGLILADFIPFALLERKLKTGSLYMPVPVMESIRVPTLDEAADATLACAAALQRLPELEESNFFNEQEIYKRRDRILEGGKKFYQNMLTELPKLGVDIKNPIHCLLAIKRLQGAKLEELCHPAKRDPGRYRGIAPYLITDLMRKALDRAQAAVEDLRSKHDVNELKGKKIIVCSGDTHEYGLMLVNYVFCAFGAECFNLGVDTDPEEALDAAAEKGTPYIAVSIHNGQSLAWAERAVNEMQKRNQEVRLFMGGRLNTVKDGLTEPVDVSEEIASLGVHVSNDLDIMLKELSRT